MEKTRCDWPKNDELYLKYHDEEWGVPVTDDKFLFEYLILETFQAGLSWITVLRKRENFRRAFDNFNYNKIAEYGEDKVLELLSDPGIIRNKAKIYGAIANAGSFITIQAEFGSFSKYIWSFVEFKPIVNSYESIDQLPSRTELSDKISADLKKRGFKFVGSTVIYAHMQATGMVNDHIIGCFRHAEINTMSLSHSGY